MQEPVFIALSMNCFFSLEAAFSGLTFPTLENSMLSSPAFLITLSASNVSYFDSTSALK